MLTAFPFLVKAVSAVMAALFIPLSALTGGIDLFGEAGRPDNVKVNIAGPSAFLYSQGVTTDGEYFYFSSKSTLLKTGSDKKTPEKINLSAIPDGLKEKFGIKHIGGISFFEGKIYAGMEDSKIFKNPIIGVFSSETLELEEYYRLDETSGDGELLVKKGVPWVAVDPDTGYLYVGENNRTPGKLYYYDVNDGMKRLGEIALDGAVSSIQGAEFYSGCLYAATNDDTAAVYKIDISAGKSEKILDRNLIPPGEGEGMTVAERDGKPVIVAVDMGTLFVNAFVREFKLDI